MCWLLTKKIHYFTTKFNSTLNNSLPKKYSCQNDVNFHGLISHKNNLNPIAWGLTLSYIFANGVSKVITLKDNYRNRLIKHPSHGLKFTNLFPSHKVILGHIAVQSKYNFPSLQQCSKDTELDNCTAVECPVTGKKWHVKLHAKVRHNRTIEQGTCWADRQR